MTYEFDPQNWHEVSAPKRKGDYLGKYLQIKVDSPTVYGFSPCRPSFIKANAIIRIENRQSYGQIQNASLNCPRGYFADTSARVLVVSWYCPTCGHAHREGLPEVWIAEGKLVFVEKQAASAA